MQQWSKHNIWYKSSPKDMMTEKYACLKFKVVAIFKMAPISIK